MKVNTVESFIDITLLVYHTECVIQNLNATKCDMSISLVPTYKVHHRLLPVCPMPGLN